MKKLYYSIWLIITVMFGIFDASFGRILSGVEDGVFISPLVLLVVGAWLAEDYVTAVFIMGLGGIVKDIFSNSFRIGWFSLFGILIMVGFGVIKYYTGITGRWLLVLESIFLAVFLYAADMFISRGFSFTLDAFFVFKFGRLLWWIVGNGIGFFLCKKLVEIITKFIEKKISK